MQASSGSIGSSN
ncbi:hypothetical protein EVAR_72582_1, partial [Eumeta japonica]